jgi:hypothetical protein
MDLQRQWERLAQRSSGRNNGRIGSRLRTFQELGFSPNDGRKPKSLPNAQEITPAELRMQDKN